MTNNNKQINVI